VEAVLGKAGRFESATDPAPLSMLETVIRLKPTSEWRRVPTWYSNWAPEWLQSALHHITPRTLTQAELIQQMDAAIQIPGLINSWTMPIKGRVEMQSTGIRTALGVKVTGTELSKIEETTRAIESALRPVNGTRNVFAERAGSGYYLDINWDRAELARYGISMEEAQSSVEIAIGGETVSTALIGRERIPISVRYNRDFRSNTEAIKAVLVTGGSGQVQIPLSRLAKVQEIPGPTMLRTEGGMLAGYVYLDVTDPDLTGYMARAGKEIQGALRTSEGVSWAWSGQYEAIQRVHARLQIVVPLTLLLIVTLLQLSTRSTAKTGIVLLAVPFSAIGAVWFLHFLGYQMSVGVWVGLIALLGVDAETGVFMLMYLEQAYEKARREGQLRNLADLQLAIRDGAVQRLRPKFMTVATMLAGLLPIMWSDGTGSEVMKRIAAPMIGGIVTSFLLELLVYPVLYQWLKERELRSLGILDSGAELSGSSRIQLLSSAKSV